MRTEIQKRFLTIISYWLLLSPLIKQLYFRSGGFINPKMGNFMSSTFDPSPGWAACSRINADLTPIPTLRFVCQAGRQWVPLVWLHRVFEPTISQPQDGRSTTRPLMSKCRNEADCWLARVCLSLSLTVVINILWKRHYSLYYKPGGATPRMMSCETNHFKILKLQQSKISY